MIDDATPPPTLLEAEARSRNARERLMETLGQMQDKFNPMALAQGAVESVAVSVVRDTVKTVRSRPRTIATAAGVMALFFVRKPLARLLWKGAKHATATVPASLKAKRHQNAISKRSPKKGSSK